MHNPPDPCKPNPLQSIGLDPAGMYEALASRGILPRSDGIAQARLDWRKNFPPYKSAADIYPGKFGK